MIFILLPQVPKKNAITAKTEKFFSNFTGNTNRFVLN
jgi:hypothetical protein